MRLLQVCNVGNILGGTAACAWSVTRALPQVEHVVAFLDQPTSTTRAAFAPAQVVHWSTVTAQRVAAVDPHLILRHNTHPRRVVGRIDIPTVQYAHSAASQAAADMRVYCSRWLAERHGDPTGHVLYQSVPKQPNSQERRSSRQRSSALIVGRLCSPQRGKWPDTLPDFYRTLARQHPHIEWQFVGCPPDLEAGIAAACEHRVRFLPAGPQARRHLLDWDALLYHHPTLTESFGRTVAEAMRAGGIPIVDDRGGFREQIAPGTGFLCGDLAAFSQALTAIANADIRERCSTAAADHADRHFSLAAFSNRLLATFHHVARLTAAKNSDSLSAAAAQAVGG